MAFTQAPLPYDPGALEEHNMSARTFEFHYGKHHAAYVTNLNNLVKDTPMADMPLEEVIKTSFGDAAKVGIFNNAAQVWNHTFFWSSMKPNGGGAPTGALAAKIDSDLGGFDKLKEAFKAAATTQFGSGWAWLVLENGALKVTKTGNAENPLVHGQTPLLTLDVWEHAYYIDFQNRRPDFISNYLDQLVNWDFANHNLAACG
jgi:superoxide dismutase, Fe-Mn family